MSLTHGAVRTLASSEGHSSNPGFNPTVQLIQIKPVGSSAGGPSNAQERFRAIVSDGQNFVQGMLATQLNHLVHSGQIVNNTIVRVDDFMNNLVQGRTVIILLKVEVINVNPGQKFGNPVDVEKAGGGAQPGAVGSAPQAQPMYNRQVGAGAGASASAGQQMAGRGGVYQQHQQGGGGVKAENRNNPYGGGGGSGPGGPQNTYNQVGNRFGATSGGQPSSAPIVRSSTTASGQHITPITNLNMYQNRWTIKARVTSKSDIRTWANSKGEGSLFSVELLDNSGHDIRATFFREAVDKFYNMLEVDKVYTFSGGRLKPANMQYNTCKSGYEITFDQHAEIHLDNDTGDIKQQLFEFRKIAELENIEPGSNVDVLAVVKGVGEVSTIVSKKTGQELTKCELTLVDDTGVEISLTVWGDKANEAQANYGHSPVVAFRKARVSDFGGRSLSASGSATVNPRIPETDRLLTWWKNVGMKGGTRSLSSGGGGRMPSFEERKTISAIKDESMGYNSEKPDWVSFKGTINFIKKDKEGGAWYTGCANSGEPCKNRFKVTLTPDGNYQCDKCMQTSPTCVRRFVFSATIADDTSTTWVSFFNEQAETLLGGVTADEVFERCRNENYDDDAYDSYFAKANFTDWIFNCKVKQEMVQDEQRVKTSVYSLHPVDYVKESTELLGAIAKF